MAWFLPNSSTSSLYIALGNKNWVNIQDVRKFNSSTWACLNSSVPSVTIRFCLAWRRLFILISTSNWAFCSTSVFRISIFPSMTPFMFSKSARFSATFFSISSSGICMRFLMTSCEISQVISSNFCDFGLACFWLRERFLVKLQILKWERLNRSVLT